MARHKALPLIEDFDRIPDEALIPADQQPFPIPAHWSWVKLGSIAKVLSGGTPKTTVPEYYEGGDVAWITPSDLSGYKDLFISRGKKNITNSGLAKSAATLLPKGTVCLTTRAPIGYVVIAASELATNQGFKNFIPQDFVSSQYLAGYLSSQSKLLESMASGTTFLELSKSRSQEIPVPLPPLNEQERIAESLGKHLHRIDDSIDKLDQFSRLSETRTDVVLQAGIQGFLSSNWRETHGLYRVDWKVTSLGNSFQWSSGGTPSRKKPEYFTGDIPWIKSGELNDDIVTNVTEHITSEAIDNSSAKVFPKGSVGIAMYGATIGRVGILGADAATNQAVAVALTADHTLPRYLFYYLRAHRNAFIALGKGGAQPNISQRVIKAFPFEIPSLPEQEEIIRLIELNLDALEKVDTLVAETLQKLQQARENLVAAAFAGKLSV